LKAHEFSQPQILTEVYDIPSEIDNFFARRGYRKLNPRRTSQQHAYLEPSGTVLKVIGPKNLHILGIPGMKKNIFDVGQQALITFAKYCQAHSSNPFLPRYYGYTTREFNGNTYLLMRMERLFPFSRNLRGVPEILTEITDVARFDQDELDIQAFQKRMLKNNRTQAAFTKFIDIVGDDGFRLLWKTIGDLTNQVYEFMDQNNLPSAYGGIDVENADNWMMRANNEIVFYDPWRVESM
jgi:hypothetical protein